MWVVLLGLAAVVLLSYSFHDLVLYFLWRGRQPAIRTSAQLHEWPDLTFVIPAANEEATIEAKIENISMAYPPDRTHIIVVLNNSTDVTRSICQTLDVSVVESVPGKLNALEAGRLAAETDYVLVTDCDVTVDERTIKRLVSDLVEAPDDVCAVSAFCRYAFASSNRLAAKMNAHEYKHVRQCQRQGELASSAMVQGPCYIYRRSLFPAYPVNATEDELSVAIQVVRAGYRVQTDVEAVCQQVSSASFGPVLTMLIRHAGRQVHTCVNSLGIILASKIRMYGLVVFPFQILLPRCLPFVTVLWLLVPFLTEMIDPLLFYSTGIALYIVLALFNPFAALQVLALHGAWIYALMCRRMGSTWNHQRLPASR